mmetsp:Transcript_8624/g.19228  ORF Transcript_8624/g.19228 Transcript_8624/m.19228 type:complete len:764 (+) Transcript_8624:100-2391(+)
MATEQVQLFGKLGSEIHKKLADKNYDTRKEASMKIEEVMRNNPNLDAKRVMNYLHSQFLDNSQGNHKKGGLIGTAAVAIALDKERLEEHLEELIDCAMVPVSDEDPRVRYYSCEALYNISKCAAGLILKHFTKIFDGLCKLSADVDVDVRSGVLVLDRLMKDIVQQNYKDFKLDDFFELLEHRVTALNPHIRQLVLAWIKLLVIDLKNEDQGQVVLVSQLPPSILSGLFKMLADNSRDVRQCADSCLNSLLQNATEVSMAQALEVIGKTSDIVASECLGADKSTRLSAQIWLHQFVRTLTQALRSGEGDVPPTWLKLLPTILRATLTCVRDTDTEVARMAVDTHAGLLEMVHNLGGDRVNVSDLVDELVTFMDKNQSGSNNNNNMAVRTACLQWVCMLLTLCPDGILSTADDLVVTSPSKKAGGEVQADVKKKEVGKESMRDKILRPVLDSLRHSESEVVVAALKVLAQIMEGKTEKSRLPSSLVDDSQAQARANESMFSEVSSKILNIFEEDRQLLETRGTLIIRQLCKHLDVRRLYITVAHYVRSKGTNAQFAQQLVQTFSWILLTAPETKVLREELVITFKLEEYWAKQQKEANQPVPLFIELLQPWFHNPVSALSLCLWSQQYELSTELVARFAAMEPTIDFLTQLDQLVYLIDSPVFSRLRLQLLDPRSHPALFKCLLGLSMLLPQARAFSILRERLHVMHSSLLLEATAAAPARPEPKGGGMWFGSNTQVQDKQLKELLEQFDQKASELTKLYTKLH